MQATAFAMAVPAVVVPHMGVYWVFSQVPEVDVDVLVVPPAVAPPVDAVEELPPVGAAVEELPPVLACVVVADVLPPVASVEVWPPVASLPPAGFCDVAGLLLDEHPSVPSKAPSVSIETADVI